MDNIDQNFEYGVPASEKKKKKREPFRVSLSVCILCILLACLIVFMSTYVTLSLNAKRAINEAYTRVSHFEKLIEIAEVYEKNYLYGVDAEQAADAVAGMYGYAVGDQYSSYYTAEEWKISQSASSGNATGIGVYVVMNEDGNILVARVMEDTPAEQAGLKDGDIITAVDGKSVVEVGYEAAVDMVLGEIGKSVSFDVLRDGEAWEIDVVRGSYDPQTIFTETVTVEGELYGYIHIVQFEGTTLMQFTAAMEALIEAGVKGFVFDVRNNPGGDLWAIIRILDYLLPEGPIVHIVSSDEGEAETYSSDASEIDMPMVVLANENTASAAELFTSALKDYDKAEIVGKKTYGKGCGQTGKMLSDTSMIFVTAFLYSPPFSENYDGIGIYPDHEIDIGKEWVNTNLFLVPHEQDAQLSRAIDVLHEMAN